MAQKIGGVGARRWGGALASVGQNSPHGGTVTSLSRQALQDLAAATTYDDVLQRLLDAAASLDFDRVAAVMIRGELGRHAWMKALTNAPAAYLEQQRSLDDTLRDPVMAALRRSTAAITYDQGLYVKAGCADLWDAQAPFGYSVGVACSAHEPGHHEEFMLGFDRSSPLPGSRIGIVRLLADAQLLTVHAQVAMQRCAAAESQVAAQVPTLTPVQVECLKRLADGMPIDVIADRLRLSEADTVRVRDSAARQSGTASPIVAALRCVHDATPP